MNKSEYRFNEKRNTACFACVHVMAKSKPILFVNHDDDSYWQFTCGANGHPDEDIRIISLEQATEIDNSINEIADLPECVCAERENIESEWIIKSNA